MCSDENVTFTNSSQGADIERWFYRVQGTATEIDPRTTRNVTYKMPNTSSSNPIIYEVVYRSTNTAGCPAPDVVTPITVYRGVDASFSNTTPTVFVGGHSAVTFTNTSAPVDGSDFRYEWDFGLDGNPATSQGTGPFVLDYTTPGPKDITLLATNIVAEAAGLSCSDEFRKTIQIVVPPLIADFTAIPLKACFPTDITITENLATGDTFAWRVLDNAGIAGQSNAELPVFKIPAPGKYTIELVTSNSFTGDQKVATKDVIIYDLPIAEFVLRPTTVYVPDMELTTFNLAEGATDYLWDFGDGTTSDEKEPTHKYRIEGVYDVMLIAMHDYGDNIVCVDSATRKVTAKQGGVTRVPNAFTPNPNGPTSSAGTPGIPGSNTFNDVFLPQVKGAEEFNMQVFDRWGNLVFESNNSNIGWDGYDRNGKLMPAGVYVYKLTLRLSDGQRTTQVGDITMIR
jgi:gliding motility-associated-like protein